MTRDDLVAFARRHKLAVEASVASGGAPQAAVVGVVTSEAFEVFFDTLETSRKCANLRRDGRAALVVGWDLGEGKTLQIEGAVDEPAGADLDRLRALYFESFPDGVARAQAGGIVYFRVQPAWARFSDFSGPEPLLVEFDRAALETA